ncbi:LCP family protein [Tumebacillus permanentifrigoris]|uniref:LytR family transcriptional attenuator n=1 Tax=Tumebacillus permanentifrigoris TaxID=378543 RepID=A0A316D8D7_9BACL|nr:LCP family protein [Tumebacillus permanentifrigoris]PWK10321.1 LytR family transcriptional attenuator [Tumebacillus permanentifrigoris]
MKKKVVWRLISFVLVVVVLFAGYNVYSMFSFFHTVSANKPFSTGSQPLNTAKWEGKGVVNILFMGVDRRDTNERPRSDTMLLASINPDTKQVAVFSIMRDTYVDIPGFGKGKINAAFADGGPELLIDTIQNFLKVPIHYYVATDFEGFAKIIDAIGGIDVDVPENFVHADDGVYDINLKKGMQHLSGQQALQYVRYRGTPRADFDRTERQRQVVKLVAEKIKSPGMLMKAPQILKQVEPYTQSNLGDNLFSLGSLAVTLDAPNMKTEQIPAVEDLQETFVGQESVLLPNVAQVREHVQEILNQPVATAQDPANAPSGAGNGSNSGTTNGGTGGTGTSAGDSKSNGSTTSKPNNGGTSTGGKTAPTGTGKTAKVTGEYVNLRAKPGTEFAVIGQVYAGDVLDIVEEANDWFYVQTSSGMFGYVKSTLVQVQ